MGPAQIGGLHLQGANGFGKAFLNQQQISQKHEMFSSKEALDQALKPVAKFLPRANQCGKMATGVAHAEDRAGPALSSSCSRHRLWREDVGRNQRMRRMSAGRQRLKFLAGLAQPPNSRGRDACSGILCRAGYNSAYFVQHQVGPTSHVRRRKGKAAHDKEG